MPKDHRAKLAAISRFDQLIAYLRDEMDWPIDQGSFVDEDDLFYDYSPSELGIDDANAAKIEQIRRLVPLSANQPWGIFFVKFEPKRLPVVALRRILSSVAKKKRASANSADRLAWSADDLLFISNYGEGETRQISFAHFSQPEGKTDLPILKVLGWDNRDTPLHLDDVAELLTSRLAWPESDDDVDDWRRSWSSAFVLAHREVVETSQALSVELAALARATRDRINTVLRIETRDGPLTTLMAAFRETLVHDLSADDFADMYAQTIAYGLLAARVANPSKATAGELSSAMPAANPFLRELMEAFLAAGGRKSGAIGLDFDELGVNDVVALLDHANLEAVVRDFGDRNPLEDPVIHFYERFLSEYDAEKRVSRGVFYTPRPVVSFIARSVHETLRSEFGLEDGLADITTWGEMASRNPGLEIPDGVDVAMPFVQILDPAVGTGTFLVEVIEVIHRTMAERWTLAGHSSARISELWNEYVPVFLLPRLCGYELMMAPYAIAHMKVELKLIETGYRFKADDRARIYLTNALESEVEVVNQLAFAIEALAHEADQVNSVKSHSRFTVVLGNPPYSIASGNLSEENRRLVERYRFVDGERIRERGALQFEKNIQDDYVKYFALGEDLVLRSGHGILAFITNGNYLDASTLRGLRSSLRESFSCAYVFDLHGDGSGVSVDGSGGADENVFDIQQGVAIGIFARPPAANRSARRGDLGGTRRRKSEELLRLDCYEACSAIVDQRPPNYYLSEMDGEIAVDWAEWEDLHEMFGQYSAGIITARDALVIDTDRERLVRRMSKVRDSSLEDVDLLKHFEISNKRGWDVSKARQRLAVLSPLESAVSSLAYRPFDSRWIFYDKSFVWGRAHPTMKHLGRADNVALTVCKQLTKTSADWSHVFVARDIGESGLVSNRSKEIATFFPAFLKDDGSDQLISGRSSNLRPDLRAGFQERYLGQTAGESDVTQALVSYVYAILHSGRYRAKYREVLARGFPRIPLEADPSLVAALVGFGERLVNLHLLEQSAAQPFLPEVIGEGDLRVEKVSYEEETVWLDAAGTRGFSGVSERAWQFRVGAYQVCEKWLKDRQAKGGKRPRPAHLLTNTEISRYQHIVAAVSETIDLMNEIDNTIEAHGGWPGAFRLSSQLD